MKRKVIFIILMIFLSSCGSCNKVNKQDINSNKKMKVFDPSNNKRLSPGTVSIRATIVDVNKDLFQLRVDKILGYGHSTPELVKGEKIYVSVKNNELKKQITHNSSFNITLKYFMKSAGEREANNWELIKLK